MLYSIRQPEVTQYKTTNLARDYCIAKRLANLEENTSETICIEVTISKKKWCIIFVYRPPHLNNKKVFFSELTPH